MVRFLESAEAILGQFVIHGNLIQKNYLRFFETPEVGIFGVFILIKYENGLKLVTSDISP